MSPRVLTIVATVLTFLVPPVLAGDNGRDIHPVTSPSGVELVLVGGGSCLQGDTSGGGYPYETPVRRVTVPSFYLGMVEVTFADYDLFCDETARARPSDSGWGRASRPVINVSWLDAAEYCNWLSRREALAPFYSIEGQSVATDWAADGYRLPTEAEWEYAARGGEDGPGQYALGWCVTNGGGRTHPVAEKEPNALGLYDMSGNVWEWCNDWFALFAAGDAENPRGPDQGQYRVLRGGSWYDTLGQRPSARTRHLPAMRLPMLGFRVARSAGPG